MTQSQMTRILNLFAVSIAFLICIAVLQHVYKRHFVSHSAQQSYAFSDLPALDAPPVTANIGRIAEKHIFGEVPKQTAISKPSKPAAPVEAPLTPLNIKLTGIILGTAPDNGMAMFEVERGRTLVVEVNEDIGKTSAKLNQVLPGEALIDRNGTIESVKMVRKVFNIAQAKKTSTTPLPQPYTKPPQFNDVTGELIEQSANGNTHSENLKNTNVKISSPLQRNQN